MLAANSLSVTQINVTSDIGAMAASVAENLAVAAGEE